MSWFQWQKVEKQSKVKTLSASSVNITKAVSLSSAQSIPSGKWQNYTACDKLVLARNTQSEYFLLQSLEAKKKKKKKKKKSHALAKSPLTKIISFKPFKKFKHILNI